MEFFKSAVASAISKGPPFPYTFGEKLDLEQSIWTLYNGTKKEDGSPCTIFSFDVNVNRSRLPLAKNALRKLRTLRHPGIIKVLDSVETDTYIYIATERVTPLGWHVRRKALSAETLKWGLCTAANTLRFITEEASSVHGNVRVSSFFTSESGEWRLGGCEILSSMKEDDAIIYNYGSSVPDLSRYNAPEVVKGGWDAIKRNPVPAVDSYGFGLLVAEVFTGRPPTSTETANTANIPPNMQQSYKRLLNSNPKARLSVAHFLEQGRRSGGFFETPLIRLSEGVESLGLKSESERAELLSELDEVSEDFPEDFFKMKILPELLKSVEFGGGGPKVFGFVMKIGAKLSDDEYDSRITPVLLRLFASPDRQMRVCLLDHLPTMIDHFSQKIVTDKVFPQLVAGFTDLAPIVRESTVKSVLTLITKLSDRAINGELLKCLAKTSNDEQPGIRTNTTICLGKIARSLGVNTRQKVLIAAFVRSLKDPFVHGRNAALQALAATSDLFPEEDCATKVLPSVCLSLIDKEKLVRDQANKTLDIYVARVRKYAATLPDTVLPPPSANTQANGAAAAAPRIGTPQTDTSWSGWAISSFTNKLASTSGEIQAKPTNPSTLPIKPPHSAPLPRPNSANAAMKSSPQLPTSSTLKPQPAKPLIVRSSTEQFFGEAQAEDDDLDDAWGELGEESFFDAPADPVPSIPVISTTSSSTTTSPTKQAYDDGGEPDFAGWLSAQAQAKQKAPLPKGLAKAKPAAVGPSPLGGGASAAKKSVVAGARARTAKVVPKKVIDTKPKETSVDDDWANAWD